MGREKILKNFEAMNSLTEENADQAKELFAEIVEDKNGCMLLSLMIMGMLGGAGDFLNKIEENFDDEDFQEALDECERVAMAFQNKDKIDILKQMMSD